VEVNIPDLYPGRLDRDIQNKDHPWSLSMQLTVKTNIIYTMEITRRNFIKTSGMLAGSSLVGFSSAKGG
jgi:hypothetical protein